MSEFGDVGRLKGNVDAFILTIRKDEHEAVLDRLPAQHLFRGRRIYTVGSLPTDSGRVATVAELRLTDAGTGPAQAAAHDAIEDLAPDLIGVVGIAGGVPASEFTLGDVMLATRLADLRVQALRPGAPPQLELRGERVQKDLANLLVNLPRTALGEWSAPASITAQRPPVSLEKDRFEGPEGWQQKLRESFDRHFGGEAPRQEPIFFTGTVASSDLLVRDPETVTRWLEGARKIESFEMEAAGVMEAAAATDPAYPVLVVRGLSDVVGYRRHPDWTTYACHSAAAWTMAFLRSGLWAAIRRP